LDLLAHLFCVAMMRTLSPWQLQKVGFSTNEVHEAMGVATLVGGTIVFHIYEELFEYWEELQNV